MTPREELEMLEELAKLEGTDKPTLGSEVKAVGLGGGKKGVAAWAGLPGDVLNFFTQEVPKATKYVGLGEGAPFFPPVSGTKDAQAVLDHYIPSQKPQTQAGRIAEAGLGGAIAAGKGGLMAGMFSGMAGQGAKELGGDEWAPTLSMLPFLGKAGWDLMRPRRAEHTARDVLRNVTPADKAKIAEQQAQFGKYGGAALPGQVLPEHTGAANLTNSLAATSQGKPIVDALVKQQGPQATMKKEVQKQVNDLMHQAEQVNGFRIQVPPKARTGLENQARALPGSLAIPQGSREAQMASREIDELVAVLGRKPTPRELSVYADSLSARQGTVPGMGPFYPALASKVSDTAKKAGPTIAAADKLVGSTRELEKALERVGLPKVTRIVEGNPGSAAMNVPLAAGAAITHHPLIVGGAISRMARGLISGNPQAKLAEALADPSMKKLRSLAGSSRMKDVPMDLLRAELQYQMQQGTE